MRLLLYIHKIHPINMVEHRLIKNDDSEKITSVLKYLRPDGDDYLNLDVDKKLESVKALFNVYYEEPLELSQNPKNAKSLFVFVLKEKSNKYDIRLTVEYDDGDMDEEFMLKHNISISQAVAWIENWVKRFPSTKIYYNDIMSNRTTYFGKHTKAPKKSIKPKYACLEDAVRRMW